MAAPTKSYLEYLVLNYFRFPFPFIDTMTYLNVFRIRPCPRQWQTQRSYAAAPLDDVSVEPLHGEEVPRRAPCILCYYKLG